MYCGLRGGKGVKVVKTKGWGSCCQTGNQGGGKFVTMSKKLALQVSRGSLLFLQGVERDCLYIVWILNILNKQEFCVQVKNKPRVEYNVINSWIHSRGSETVAFTVIQGSEHIQQYSAVSTAGEVAFTVTQGSKHIQQYSAVSTAGEVAYTVTQGSKHIPARKPDEVPKSPFPPKEKHIFLLFVNCRYLHLTYCIIFLSIPLAIYIFSFPFFV